MTRSRSIVVALCAAALVCSIEGVRSPASVEEAAAQDVPPADQDVLPDAPAADGGEGGALAAQSPRPLPAEPAVRPKHLEMAARGADLEDYLRAVERNAAGSLLEADAGTAKLCHWPDEWDGILSETCKFLGKGAFGSVHKAALQCKESFSVAVKAMNSIARSEFLAEVKSLKIFSGHPSFVAYIAHAPKASAQRKIGTARIMMEAATGGTLKDIIQNKHVGRSDRLQLFFDMLAGIEHMHSKKMVHRDLKPANIFISATCFSASEQCHAKVGDLGLACDMEQRGDCSGVDGTPYYMAPELLKQETVSYSNDMWALGLMLYELTFRALPERLEEAGQYSGLRKLHAAIKDLDITTQDERFRQLHEGPRKVLLRGMLAQSPKKRMTATVALETTARWIGSALKPAEHFKLPSCLSKKSRGFGTEVADQMKDFEKQLKRARQDARAEPPKDAAKQKPQLLAGIPEETNKGGQEISDQKTFEINTATLTGMQCCAMLMDTDLNVVSSSGRVRSRVMDKRIVCPDFVVLSPNDYILSVSKRAYTDLGEAIRHYFCSVPQKLKVKFSKGA